MYHELDPERASTKVLFLQQPKETWSIHEKKSRESKREDELSEGFCIIWQMV